MKISTLFRLIAIEVILCLGISARAQKLDSVLATYAEKYQPERVYLHYDKDTYYPGETVWFKSYLLEGISPVSVDGSKTLYVDWVDEKGKVLSHTVSPIVESVSNGQFDIPNNFSGNAIHVRAYTKWMLNFDTSFLYQKDIRILTNNTKAITEAKQTAAPSLQFFPEGGDAVAGIKNRIAFKASDQWGRPVKIKGVIQGSGNAVVDSLRTIHDGMGYFFFQPQEGVKYTAKWKDEKGAQHTTELPLAKPAGVVVQLAVSGAKRFVNVTRSAETTEALKTLHLIGTMQQQLVFKTDIDLKIAASATKTIPTETLPTGIATITLFDANWNAIAERITFINNNEYSFPVEMNVEHWGTSKRGRNEIQVRVPAGIQSNLSVSITDVAIERDSSENIISNLLLTSDLKGKVNNPSYYFLNSHDSTSQQLDLVMLTNGWRRFKWEDVMKGKFPATSYAKDTSYLALSGKLYGVPAGGLTGGNTLILFLKSKDSSAKMIVEPVANNGSFYDPSIVFFDTLSVYYQPPKSFSGADVRFMESRLPALNYVGRKRLAPNPFADTTGFYRHTLLADENARLIEMMKGKTLETVVVRGTTKSPVQVLDEKYASGLFKGADAYQFDLVSDPLSSSYMDVFNYLQGKVAGLQITGNGSNVNMQWRGATPQLFLDEVSTDVSMISSIPVNDIAYVKVFRPPFFGGTGGGSGGGIAIYTRRGNDVKSAPGKGLNRNTITGYTPVREFYAPNYGTFTKQNEQRDVRTTLYWNPTLETSPQKPSVKFSFYNNDVSKAFRIVIEGMTKEGQLAHVEQVIE